MDDYSLYFKLSYNRWWRTLHHNCRVAAEGYDGYDPYYFMTSHGVRGYSGQLPAVNPVELPPFTVKSEGDPLFAITNSLRDIGREVQDVTEEDYLSCIHGKEVWDVEMAHYNGYSIPSMVYNTYSYSIENVIAKLRLKFSDSSFLSGFTLDNIARIGGLTSKFAHRPELGRVLLANDYSFSITMNPLLSAMDARDSKRVLTRLNLTDHKRQIKRNDFEQEYHSLVYTEPIPMHSHSFYAGSLETICGNIQEIPDRGNQLDLFPILDTEVERDKYWRRIK